jgi:hypothetical protein
VPKFLHRAKDPGRVARLYSAARTRYLRRKIPNGSTNPGPTRAAGRLLHQEHDRIPIPEDVPALGVRKGDEGVIRRLTYLRNTVFAFAMVTYSTGQLRAWVVVEVKPEWKVRSYTTATG